MALAYTCFMEIPEKSVINFDNFRYFFFPRTTRSQAPVTKSVILTQRFSFLLFLFKSLKAARTFSPQGFFFSLRSCKFPRDNTDRVNGFNVTSSAIVKSRWKLKFDFRFYFALRLTPSDYIHCIKEI